MIYAVLDTNTLVSAILEPRGIPNQLLEAARAGRYALVTSAAIVSEVTRTLGRDRIQRKYRVTSDDIRRIREFLENDTLFVEISRHVSGIASHPEDDLILGTAVSSQAAYLVTGDRKLREVMTFVGLTVLTPRSFLEVLEAAAPE